jgi:hypothetical protein
VKPEDELIELAARRARTAMADEKTGFGNLLQLLRDVTRQLARSRRTGEAVNATHWSSAIRNRTTGDAPSSCWSEASDP